MTEPVPHLIRDRNSPCVGLLVRDCQSCQRRLAAASSTAVIERIIPCERAVPHYEVAGWDLNCAITGAVLAELSLESRIDTDMESLFLLGRTETGNPSLDPILKEISAEPAQRNAQYFDVLP